MALQIATSSEAYDRNNGTPKHTEMPFQLPTRSPSLSLKRASLTKIGRDIRESFRAVRRRSSNAVEEMEVEPELDPNPEPKSPPQIESTSVSFPTLETGTVTVEPQSDVENGEILSPAIYTPTEWIYPQPPSAQFPCPVTQLRADSPTLPLTPPLLSRSSPSPSLPPSPTTHAQPTSSHSPLSPLPSPSPITSETEDRTSTILTEKQSIYRHLMGLDDPPEQRQAVKEVLDFFQRWESEKAERERREEKGGEYDEEVVVNGMQRLRRVVDGRRVGEELMVELCGGEASAGAGGRDVGDVGGSTKAERVAEGEDGSLFPAPLRYTAKSKRAGVVGGDFGARFSHSASVLLSPSPSPSPSPKTNAS